MLRIIQNYILPNKFRIDFVIIILILISILPELFFLDFNYGLRTYIFVVLLCMYFLVKILKQKSIINKNYWFCDLDVSYFSLIILMCVSFIIFNRRNECIYNYILILLMFLLYISMRMSNNIRKNIKRDFTIGLIIICMINIIIALFQIIDNKPVIGTFSHTNHLAMFLAIIIPILYGIMLEYCANYNIEYKNKCLINAIILMIGIILLTSMFIIIYNKCRTAIVGCGIVLLIQVIISIPIFIHSKLLLRYIFNTWKNKCLFTLIIAFALLFTFIFLYIIKPISFYGRLHIWLLSNNIFIKNYITGIGCFNFRKMFNIYQDDYFSMDKGFIIQKMIASPVYHAFNEPLEIAAELGMPGIIVYCLFLIIIFKNILKIIKRCYLKTYKQYEIESQITSVCPHKNNKYLSMGMAAAVLCFFIMSLTHFPSKILPVFLIFNISLAWITSDNERYNSFNKNEEFLWKRYNSNVLKAKKHLINSIIRFSFVLSLLFVIIYFQQFKDMWEWHEAYILLKNKNYNQSLILYSNVYDRLKWNGRFSKSYGNLLFLTGNNYNAIECYEAAVYNYPDPYIYENLGVAYMRTINEETEIKNIKKYNIPCLSKNEVIIKAADCWILSDNILPWRLTTKYNIMNLYYYICDTNNTIKYAKKIVNTPMKKYTKSGVEMKKSAQKMLNELGVSCDDPGIVVFDIHDRSTWNEGKW